MHHHRNRTGCNTARYHLYLKVIVPLNTVFRDVCQGPNDAKFGTKVKLITRLNTSNAIRRHRLHSHASSRGDLLEGTSERRRIIRGLRRGTRNMEGYNNTHRTKHSHGTPHGVYVDDQSTMTRHTTHRRATNGCRLGLGHRGRRRRYHRRRGTHSIAHYISDVKATVMRGKARGGTGRTHTSSGTLVGGSLIQERRLNRTRVGGVLTHRGHKRRRHRTCGLPGTPARVYNYISRTPRNWPPTTRLSKGLFWWEADLGVRTELRVLPVQPRPSASHHSFRPRKPRKAHTVSDSTEDIPGCRSFGCIPGR